MDPNKYYKQVIMLFMGLNPKEDIKKLSKWCGISEEEAYAEIKNYKEIDAQDLKLSMFEDKKDTILKEYATKLREKQIEIEKKEGMDEVIDKIILSLGYPKLQEGINAIVDLSGISEEEALDLIKKYRYCDAKYFKFLNSPGNERFLQQKSNIINKIIQKTVQNKIVEREQNSGFKL